MARVIVFTSAEKQVGKTSLCVNLALYLGQLGHSTCLFNADPDPASAYNLLDIHPRYALKDLIENRVRMDQAVTKDVHGIDFFPGCPGIERIRSADRSTRNRLHRSFMYFNRYDFFLVDTYPGISRNVVALCKASLEVVLVMTADARSLTNAYLLLKALNVNKFYGSVMVLINKSRDLKLARRSYNRFKEAVSRYLPISAIPLGTVFFDRQVREAERGRLPYTSLYPDSDASRCIANIAKQISGKKKDDMAVSAFWSRFVDHLKDPFQIVGDLQQLHGHKPNQWSADTDDTGGTAEPGQTNAQPFPPPEPAGENRSDAETLDALSRLEAQMSDLSKEVTDIKQTLDTISDSRQTASEPKTEAESSPQPKREKLVLDFETFLAQRGKGET